MKKTKIERVPESGSQVKSDGGTAKTLPAHKPSAAYTGALRAVAAMGKNSKI